jgi:muramidase (phage lysozyme)
MDPNLKAFLDTIATSEGTYGCGDDGYNVIVGGDLFDDYSKHPDVLVTLNKAGLKSTAAGRY